MRTLTFLILALVMLGCRGAAPPPTPSSAATQETPPIADIASADPQVRYFHEQLVIYGEDVQSEFGGYLLTIDMNPRDLQQDDPKHAYDTVREKVRKIDDASLRREM